jgi:hypothetical protein
MMQKTAGMRTITPDTDQVECGEKDAGVENAVAAARAPSAFEVNNVTVTRQQRNFHTRDFSEAEFG